MYQKGLIDIILLDRTSIVGRICHTAHVPLPQSSHNEVLIGSTFAQMQLLNQFFQGSD